MHAEFSVIFGIKPQTKLECFFLALTKDTLSDLYLCLYLYLYLYSYYFFFFFWIFIL